MIATDKTLLELSTDGTDLEPIIVISPEPIDGIVSVELADQSNVKDVIQCSLPLCLLIKLLNIQPKENGKVVIMISHLVKFLGFKTPTVSVTVKFEGIDCTVLYSAEKEMTQIDEDPNTTTTPSEARELIASLSNRKIDLANQLALILREQGFVEKVDENSPFTLEEEMKLLVNDPNTKIQWMDNCTVGKKNPVFKKVFSNLLSLLSPIFRQSNLDNISHPLIDFGLKSANGLRFVILIMCKLKIIPDPTIIKYAVIAESRYGSYRNAELLMLLFLELFEMGIYSWTTGSKNQLYSLETNQLLIVFSLLIRHSPSPNIAIYYFEMIQQKIKEIGLNTKPSNVLYACLVFSLVISCKSAEEQFDEKVLLMKNLIEIYYKDCKRFNGGEDLVIDSIYENYKNDSSSSPVPSPTIEEGDAEDFDDTQSVMSFSSTLTTAIELSITEHADYRMMIRGITEDEIKRCIKHGVRKLSKDVVKCTDENCIVIYSFVQNVPRIVTVYRHVSRTTPIINNSELCDYLLTLGFYGDYNECNIELKKLLQNDIQFNNDEKKDLSEALIYLFKDCCPTYNDLELIIQVMKKYKINYKGRQKYFKN